MRATLGAVLRRRRESHEWSLAEIAGTAGISIGHLSEVERGRKDISTDRLVALARALDTTAGELYLELGRELGAGQPATVDAIAWEADPRVQLRRMSDTLDGDALRTVARFTTFLAMTETAPRKRQIGFLR